MLQAHNNLQQHLSVRHPGHVYLFLNTKPVLFKLLCLCPQAVLVYKILTYVEDPGTSSVTYGVGLSLGLFTSEFFKAFLMSLLWAVSLRTAVRLKGAFSSMAFQKVISLRAHSNISTGEVHAALHIGGLMLI